MSRKDYESRSMKYIRDVHQSVYEFSKVLTNFIKYVFIAIAVCFVGSAVLTIVLSLVFGHTVTLELICIMGGFSIIISFIMVSVTYLISEMHIAEIDSIKNNTDYNKDYFDDSV